MKYILLILMGILLVGCSKEEPIVCPEPIACPDPIVCPEAAACPEQIVCEPCPDCEITDEREKELIMELLRCENRRVVNITMESYQDEIDILNRELNETHITIDEIRKLLEDI